MADTCTMTKRNGETRGSEGTRGDRYFTPRVDIYETDKELTLYADLPGVHSDGVELQFENGELTLRGRAQQRELTGTAWLSEYEVSDFYRVFKIHETIDSTKISAECKNGVLTVHLPKVEAARPRKIAIRAE